MVKKVLKMQPKNKCLIWHRWVLKLDTGVHRYHECKDCGARIAKQHTGGYQPQDHKWVLGVKDEIGDCLEVPTGIYDE